MKYYFLLLFGSFFLVNSALSQDTLSVDLLLKRSIVTQHHFYVEKVIDRRASPSTSDVFIKIAENVIFDFYQQAMSPLEQAKGITLFVSDLRIDDESGAQVLKLNTEFIYQNQFVFESNVSQIVSTDLDRDLTDLAVQAIAHFDRSEEASVLFGTRNPTEDLDRVKATSNNDDYQLEIESVEEDRNVSAVGYQIGGLTLIGFDYEIRVSDVFGPHIGVGLSGYTFGLKIHTGELKDSPFFNISYKDGGFGAINTIAMEYGGRLTGSRNKGGFGFHYQLGLGYLTNIDPDLQERLFGDEDPPAILLSLGIGMSW